MESNSNSKSEAEPIVKKTKLIDNHSKSKVYSIVNLTKTPIRNSLDVETVSSSLQVKSYYLDDLTFEPDDKHLRYYKEYINSK